MIKFFSFQISPNTSLIIPFQLTQVSSFYLEIWHLQNISFRFFQRAVILQGEIIKPEDQWSCKRSPDILA